MIKTPQDYWVEIAKEIPKELLDEGLEDMLRVAFYFGMAAALNFIHNLTEVEDKPAALEAFKDQLEMQRLIENSRRNGYAQKDC
jgi:hypothetical protein